MSEEECKCPKCIITEKFTDYVKTCETDDELEWCIRQAVENAFHQGFKQALVQGIEENIEFLKALEEDEVKEEPKQSNLRVVDNVKH